MFTSSSNQRNRTKRWVASNPVVVGDPATSKVDLSEGTEQQWAVLSMLLQSPLLL